MTNSNIQNQFVPAYTFSKPNQPLVIANEEALIKGSNGNILMSGKVEIRLDLLPEPWINVHFNNKNKLGWSERWNLMIESSLRNQFELDLTTKGKQIKVFYHKYDPSDPNESTIDFFPCIEPIIGIGNDSTLMQYINFYLLNFKKIRGKNTHINLKDDKWIVKLKPVPESNDNFTKLEKEGGYGLTHIGFICKSNNTDFSHKEAIEILDVLEYLFSFAKGDWCTPVCPTGFNSSGKVWELWSSPKLSGFPGPETWFSEYYSEQIENLFPGFMRCWYTENLNDTLRKAIYWYISAINSKIDVGIVLTQTVLESISFGYVVNVLKEKKLIPLRNFMLPPK
ncbi:MAG: hypothetical protein NHB15_04100 [Methanosarcina barkeri]|nr:hypothetical protein [Methanosarcina sp. ERenArc_MAG2]